MGKSFRASAKSGKGGRVQGRGSHRGRPVEEAGKPGWFDWLFKPSSPVTRQSARHSKGGGKDKIPPGSRRSWWDGKIIPKDGGKKK